MSQLGQQQTIRPRNLTSVIPPRPELTDQAGHVGFVPNCDIVSFDHFVGAQDKVRQDLKADLFPWRTSLNLFGWDVARACPLQYFDKLPTR
jgi:hypothetical protein